VEKKGGGEGRRGKGRKGREDVDREEGSTRDFRGSSEGFVG
jgi:hypothetical protein